MENAYLPVKSIVENVIEETDTIKTFVVRPERKIKFYTGQFIEFSVPGIGEAPFTPSSDPNRDEIMDISIMKAGKITGILHKEVKKGSIVGLRGPYGNWYPIEKFYNKDIVLIGGGVGLAPLRSLLFKLLSEEDKFNKILLRYGAKTTSDLLYRDAYNRWRKDSKLDIRLTVDKGDEQWIGNEGVVTTILENIDKEVEVEKSIGIVCGPPIMMKFTTLKLLEKNYRLENIYLSMERNMSCGIGMCGHCRIGNFHVCKDGPIFSYKQLEDIPNLWE